MVHSTYTTEVLFMEYKLQMILDIWKIYLGGTQVLAQEQKTLVDGRTTLNKKFRMSRSVKKQPSRFLYTFSSKSNSKLFTSRRS